MMLACSTFRACLGGTGAEGWQPGEGTARVYKTPWGPFFAPWEGEGKTGLTKWCQVKNEVEQQPRHLCHHFCSGRSSGFINGAAASAVFV